MLMAQTTLTSLMLCKEPQVTSNVRAIVLDWIGADSILLNPADSEIFYFKHDVGPFEILVGNFDVLML